MLEANPCGDIAHKHLGGARVGYDCEGMWLARERGAWSREQGLS